MRYAVLSDIHSNLVALEAVLADLAEEAIDRYLCLGDIVGYGARPNQCCDLIRELDAVSIRGNHDEAAVDPAKAEWFTAPARACILWTTEQLREDNMEFLRALPTLRVVDDDITICHGSVPDPDHYTVTPLDALMSLRAMETPIAFFGHTHYSEWFVWGQGNELPEEFPIPSGGSLHIRNDHVYLINPGAVGQPRDGNEMASYAIFDDETGDVVIKRVAYDIATAAQQMREAGLPEAMYARLWLGV
ncbi:MAG: metallophosphoesterase family protein [Armatimonadota bacterium]|nr:metallophosphoesterase family protein [Armatimonadota bacterium]